MVTEMEMEATPQSDKLRGNKLAISFKSHLVVLCRRRIGGICLQGDDVAREQTQEKGEGEAASIFKEEEQRAAQMKKEEQAQKKADDLWSSFLKDVGQKPKVKPQMTPSSSKGVLSDQVPFLVERVCH